MKQTPTHLVLATCASQLRPTPASPAGFGITSLARDWPEISYRRTVATEPPETYKDAVRLYNTQITNALTVGHIVITIICAITGSFVGRMLQNYPHS
jgi:hypothetical protein